MSRTASAPGAIRIVAGEWRGRRLIVPPGDAIRPTGERQRKALFDILSHGRFAPGGVSRLIGARVVDAFAGTGALGLEALSRGAASCLFLDKAPAARTATTANVAALGAQARCRILAADASDPPAAPVAPMAPCDLVLLDPPYRSGLAAAALVALDRHGWFAPGAVAAVELSADENFPPVAGFAAIDQRVYGKSKFAMLIKSP